jgi:cobalamin transport system substrate-binding protein
MAAHSIPRSARLSLAVLMLVAVGCSPSAAVSPAPTTGAISTAALPTTPPVTPAPTAAFPVTLTDDEGTAVTIPAEPHKIVSLTPATTETLFAIGAGDRVVGKVQDVANFPAEAASVPEVATFNGVDVEKIISLGADLVVSGGSGLTQGDAVAQLRHANIAVVVSYPTSISGALAGIRMIGKAVGLGDQADALASQMQSDISALARLASTAPDQPRLFYEIDNTGGIFTPPAGSIYGEMFALAGSKPISGDANYSISLENLVAADPEVILLGDAAYGATADAVKARAGWGGMTAVKNGRILAVDDIVITRPGPRLVQGLSVLINAIHPALQSEVCAAMRLPCPTPAAQATTSPS